MVMPTRCPRCGEMVGDAEHPHICGRGRKLSAKEMFRMCVDFDYETEKKELEEDMKKLFGKKDDKEQSDE